MGCSFNNEETPITKTEEEQIVEEVSNNNITDISELKKKKITLIKIEKTDNDTDYVYEDDEIKLPEYKNLTINLSLADKTKMTDEEADEAFYEVIARIEDIENVPFDGSDEWIDKYIGGVDTVDEAKKKIRDAKDDTRLNKDTDVYYDVGNAVYGYIYENAVLNPSDERKERMKILLEYKADHAAEDYGYSSKDEMAKYMYGTETFAEFENTEKFKSYVEENAKQDLLYDTLMNLEKTEDYYDRDLDDINNSIDTIKDKEECEEVLTYKFNYQQAVLRQIGSQQVLKTEG